MNTIGPMISASARLAIGYAQRLAAGIRDDQFASFARIGDRVVQSNHPAFICGHLGLYAPRILVDLGHDASSLTPNEHFVSLFSKDAICVDDPDRAIYPPMDELFARMIEGYTRVADALDAADDASFTSENSNQAMRAKFPTQGAMFGFYVGGHFMVHMGQWSAWRRAMSMPAA